MSPHVHIRLSDTGDCVTAPPLESAALILSTGTDVLGDCSWNWNDAPPSTVLSAAVMMPSDTVNAKSDARPSVGPLSSLTAMRQVIVSRMCVKPARVLAAAHAKVDAVVGYPKTSNVVTLIAALCTYTFTKYDSWHVSGTATLKEYVLPPSTLVTRLAGSTSLRRPPWVPLYTTMSLCMTDVALTASEKKATLQVTVHPVRGLCGVHVSWDSWAEGRPVDREYTRKWLLIR